MGRQRDLLHEFRPLGLRVRERFLRANVRLGLLKLEGCRGVRRDPAGALAAFLNAAKQGDAYGQYLAGRLLLDDGDARRAIALWEAAKWLLVEIGKTVFVDWSMRQLRKCCRRRTEPVQQQEQQQEQAEHVAVRCYFVNNRRDAAAHLFRDCNWIPVGVGPARDHRVCRDCKNRQREAHEAKVLEGVENVLGH